MQLWLSANLICIIIQYADLSLMSFGDKMCSIMMYCILYWEMILGISGYGILVISLSPCVVTWRDVTWHNLPGLLSFLLDVALRVGTSWSALPPVQARRWHFVSRCSPTCSSRPIRASEPSSSPPPESWPARYTQSTAACWLDSSCILWFVFVIYLMEATDKWPL